MTRVLLLHSGFIPHYRVPIYGALSAYLERLGFELVVASDRIQPGSPHPVEFEFEEAPLGVRRIAELLRRRQVEVIILFVDMRHRYLFPAYFVAKVLHRCKMIYWGQGLNLADPKGPRSLLYRAEHALCDAIVLYAEHLRKYIAPRFHPKIFVANNTLCLTYRGLAPEKRNPVLVAHGIRTCKNIICVGRLQKRKRLDDLVAAHAAMQRPDVGLILVGPDSEDVLKDLKGSNVYHLGPLYGTDKFDLLSACDVYCLPGAVGLSIVDAFHCGLPLVTEAGDESAEMMYLKDGENGFIVPRGDIPALAHKLLLLLDDDALRQKFSVAAKREVRENGSVEKLCAGFGSALLYVTDQGRRTRPSSWRSEPSHSLSSGGGPC